MHVVIENVRINDFFFAEDTVCVSREHSGHIISPFYSPR